MTLNVGGLNKTYKHRQIFRWLHQQKPDVIFHSSRKVFLSRKYQNIGK